ncbi:MAG: L-threonylcarbamoyladenylate synthase [Gammaproteobacteria bacterium]
MPGQTCAIFSFPSSMTTTDQPEPNVEIVGFPEERAPRVLRKRIQALLEGSQVIALPTETVYGLAVRADDPVALERLRELKGRAAEQPLTWHVGSREVVQEFQGLIPLAARLAERYWPGPLTLVLKGVPSGLAHVAQRGWVGVRLPAHLGTSTLCKDSEFPLVATSANRSGEPPATDAAQVLETFPRGLGLILDGGPCRLSEPSGVLRVGPGHFELLREGLLPIEDLRRTAGRRIAFVCTGNTCRSPMAEGIARRVLEKRLGLVGDSAVADASATQIADFGFQVSSMGVFAGPGAPVSSHSVDVLAEEGIDISSHTSSPAIPEEVLALDEVYGLTRSHVDALRSNLPPGKGKQVQLLDPEGRDIPDPIGAPRNEYARTRDAIRAAIERRAPQWA